MDDWERVSARARWEPLGFFMLLPGTPAAIGLASHHSSAAKVALGLLTVLMLCEGVSLGVNFQGSADMVAQQPEMRQWKRGAPWMPVFNRVWGLTAATTAVVAAAIGFAH